MPTVGWLPWLHRASPSATLDKLSRLLKATPVSLSIENPATCHPPQRQEDGNRPLTAEEPPVEV